MPASPSGTCSMLERPWERFLPRPEAPPFAMPVDVLHDALPALAVQKRIDVPDWAERSRRISIPTYQGPFSNDFAPYMVEPARQVTSRRYGAVVFVGPARTVKSESLILNPVGHAIECKPRDTMVVCQTQDSAKQFSERKLGPMLRANPQLQARQLTGRGADNIHEKKFAGGMNLQIRWPVIGYFSQNEFFTVLLTDRDRMPDDVDGEGDPFMLARKRVQHAGSLGMVVSESSPGRLVEQDDWRASTPHEAPPCAGVLAEYNLGTRGHFYWECPHCKTAFRPLFSTLQWEKRASHGESARTVFMACPAGCVIGQDHKSELNKAGIWLHEAADGVSLVEIGDPAIRDTDIVSYWCEGPVAAMQSWDQLALRYLQGKEAFVTRLDETALKATITLDQGRPYTPAVRQVGEGLSAEAIKALSKSYPLGIAPAETRFITLQVDVQGNRFVVSAEAWGRDLEHWLIDRFDIAAPPAGAPGAIDEDGKARRAIDPPRYSEDWAALKPLLGKAYPVAGSDASLLPRAMIVDSGGAAGVTANAYKFLRAMRKAGLGHRVYVAKGRGGLDRQRAIYATPEKVLGTVQKRTSDLRIVQVGTDPLKDEVALALTRKEPGPRSYHLPSGLSEIVFAEFCAEVRTDKGWQLRKEGLRNESLDLAVYALALMIVLKGEKIDFDAAPDWARPVTENSYAVRLLPEKAAEPAKVEPVTPQRPGGRRMRSRGYH